MNTVFYLSSGRVHDVVHALADVENLPDDETGDIERGELVVSGVRDLTNQQAERDAHSKTP